MPRHYDDHADRLRQRQRARERREAWLYLFAAVIALFVLPFIGFYMAAKGW